MKFSAILHGADPKDFEEKPNKTTKNNLVFGDPEDYKQMEEKEKAELSKAMMKKFMGLSKHGG